MLYRKNHGFTLVELSIVLVIIGLIIAGILAARSMIDTSKRSRLIQDIEAYKTAFQMFKHDTGFWPGDYLITDGCAPVDLKNGYIGHWRPWGGDGTLGSSLCAATEFNGAWTELSSYGYIKGSYSYVYNPGVMPGRNPILDYITAAPSGSTARANENCGLFVGHNSYIGAGGNANGMYNRHGNAIYVIPNHWSYACLTKTMASAIDQKVDDGNPGTGWYISYRTTEPYCVNEAQSAHSSTVTWGSDVNAAGCGFLLFVDEPVVY